MYEKYFCRILLNDCQPIKEKEIYKNYKEMAILNK